MSKVQNGFMFNLVKSGNGVVVVQGSQQDPRSIHRRLDFKALASIHQNMIVDSLHMQLTHSNEMQVVRYLDISVCYGILVMPFFFEFPLFKLCI